MQPRQKSRPNLKLKSIVACTGTFRIIVKATSCNIRQDIFTTGTSTVLTEVITSNLTTTMNSITVLNQQNWIWNISIVSKVTNQNTLILLRLAVGNVHITILLKQWWTFLASPINITVRAFSPDHHWSCHN